jgi:hypothetical protein
VHRSSSGGTQEELVPRLVGALAGKKVVGVAAGDYHTVVWTPWGPVGSWAPEGTEMSMCRGVQRDPGVRIKRCTQL